MKVSEAIKILEKRKKEFGDINIEVWGEFGVEIPEFIVSKECPPCEGYKGHKAVVVC